MEKCYSYVQGKTLDQMSLNGTSIKYGKQEDIKDYWKQIVENDNQTARHFLVDRLLEKMQANCDKNGFWCPEEEIQTTFGIERNAVHLDDKNIYYTFFDTLRVLHDKNKQTQTPQQDGTLAVRSVFSTIENYFGKFNGNLDLRNQLTELNFETFEYPSISVLQNQGCGACVEKAAVAHNLWLLMGRESYYVSSTSSKFENSNDEGHAFCIIKNGEGGFMLYDHAMNNFGALQGDPIETLLSGQPLVIGEPFNNHGIYANACNLEQASTLAN